MLGRDCNRGMQLPQEREVGFAAIGEAMFEFNATLVAAQSNFLFHFY